MLKVNQKTLDHMESQRKGILGQIMRFENAELPPCPHCGSEDTADVQVGIIGRTIYIAAATSKFKLLPNGPRPGRYRCNFCNKYFGEEPEGDGKISGFTLRPRDASLQAYKDFINKILVQMGGKDEKSLSENEWENKWRTFWGKTEKEQRSSSKKTKHKSKSTSTGSTSSNMKITLSACDPHARSIFETLVSGWKEAEGTVMCIRPGRIYLKLHTKVHASGNSAKLPRNFNLLVLASPRGRRGAHIQVTWGLGNINDNFAYLDCIPKVVARFEKTAASLPGFEQMGSITRLLIDQQFKPLHTKLLMDGIKEVKDAESKAK